LSRKIRLRLYTAIVVSMLYFFSAWVCGGDIRRKESPLARQNRDEHLIMFRNFKQRTRKLVVVLSAQRIEFLGHVERDDGDAAAVVDEDRVFL
jgi:hypothetical protein